MADQASESPSGTPSLPDTPDLEWLRKQAKRRLSELRQSAPGARLANVQLELAREYGFSSWRALKAHIDARTVEGRLFAAARQGNVSLLSELLRAQPDKLLAREKPYAWTLLHAAASEGQLAVVELLLERGLDPNVREQGDNTYAMHWAAAGGYLDVVRRLADAGGDVVGRGDDHELEVIGWATCWEQCRDDVAHFLVSRGARHHIFSAIAMDLAIEVRRIVAADPASLNRRMSRNENNQLPLHFAVRKQRPALVLLLLELGADPLGVDGSGHPAAVYATSPDIDRPVMRAIRALTAAELVSAERGKRAPRGGTTDLVAALALGDWDLAARLVREVPDLAAEPSRAGALHLMAKRNQAAAARWLLDRGADPNARWAHWDSEVTPLHLAVLGGHPEMVRLLLAGGADPTIPDTKHDSDARGWAEFFRQVAPSEEAQPRGEVLRILTSG